MLRLTQSLGWRYIFFASIVAALFGLVLMRDVPESRAVPQDSYRFDFAGVITFMIAMVALQVIVTQGNKLGWTSPAALILITVTLVAGFLFFRIAAGASAAFVDFSLLANPIYTGATQIDRQLDEIYRSPRGEAAWPPLSLSRGMLLAMWHDLSDVKLEEALADRASFSAVLWLYGE